MKAMPMARGRTRGLPIPVPFDWRIPAVESSARGPPLQRAAPIRSIGDRGGILPAMDETAQPTPAIDRYASGTIKSEGFLLDGRDARRVGVLPARWLGHAHRTVRARPPGRSVADLRPDRAPGQGDGFRGRWLTGWSFSAGVAAGRMTAHTVGAGRHAVPAERRLEEVRLSTQPGAARVVVIGAGIVGNSLVYHLARLGWTDIVQVEKGPLPNPGGSTGHASNFIFLTDHSREMTALTADSVEQYKEMGVFTQSGGIEVARTPERMEELKRRMASSRSWGIESELLTPDEVKALVPYVNADIILGGFSTPGIGVVDSLRAGTIMRERAQAMGALRLAPMTEVTGIDVEDGRVTRVRTDKGDFEADVVVIACGVWSPRIGAMARGGDPAHTRGPPDDQRRAGTPVRGYRRRDQVPDHPRHGHELLRAAARRRPRGRVLRPPGDHRRRRRYPLDRRIGAVTDRIAVHPGGLRAPDGAGARARPRHPRR